MPELVEVELSRRLAERLIGRTVGSVELLDPHASALGAPRLREALDSTTFAAPRRRGKLLLLDTDRATLGMHFGMTGRLVVDGRPALDRLVYAPATLEDRWRRFSLRLRDGGTLELHDPRRLARVSVDPDEGTLGPDAASLTVDQLRTLLGGRTRGISLKARLLDQSRLAGIGNLMADELLWRAGLSPERPASSLDDLEVRRLQRRIRSTTAMLLKTGRLPHRGPDGRPGARAAVPQGRPSPGQDDRRGSDHLLVPGAPTLNPPAPSVRRPSRRDRSVTRPAGRGRPVTCRCRLGHQDGDRSRGPGGLPHRKADRASPVRPVPPGLGGAGRAARGRP